jgi:hypothetical protein
VKSTGILIGSICRFPVSGLALIFLGCDSAATVPPNGLVKPGIATLASQSGNKCELQNLVITITLPKDNPSKSQLSNTTSDVEFIRSLPRVRCRVECSIEPKSVATGQFNFGLTLMAPFGGHSRMLHSTCAGQFQSAANGKYFADLECKQYMPIDPSDKMTLSLRVIGSFSGSGGQVKVDVTEGKVIIKQEE